MINLQHTLDSVDNSRRVFIKGVGFVSLSFLLGTFFGGCEKLAEAIKNRPIRRRLRTGSPEVDADIATYRQAVSLMKGLAATDPRSWDNQAAIHGTIAGGFKYCQHGTDQFFPWHRAYLFYFEKICQKLTGNNNFGLPYWNWNQNGAINPAFLDSSSVLYLPRTHTDATGQSFVSNGALDPIMADTNFYTFSSQIEGTPHNNIHGFVGMTMGTGGSALDPVFWTHHCMVDYCWYKWNVDMGNSNPNDPAWLNANWEHFVDADGNPASSTSGVTILMPLLSYQYEGSAIGSSAAIMAMDTKSNFEKVQNRLKEGANIKFEIRQRIPIATKTAITIARPFSQETSVAENDFTRITESKSANEKVFASIEYVRLPATSDFFVRVFLNLPEANASTPIESPHYAGSFAFFGTEQPSADPNVHDGTHRHIPKFLVNVTDTLQRLRSSGALQSGSPISVQLVAVPFNGKFEKEDTELQLDSVELIVTPVIVNAK